MKKFFPLLVALGLLCIGADTVNPPELKKNKGVPNGYAPLDGSSKVPAANLPTTSGGGVTPAYDVVANFNGSGMRTTTTGTITSGTMGSVTGLSTGFTAECRVGQGILIKGAGTSGAHHVTTIATIPNTTSVTLTVNAATAVTAAIVQHDDTVAANAAHAAAYNAGGGEVFFRKTGVDGYYRINGPRNGSTNSIITIPQSILYHAVPPVIWTKGEVKGSWNGPASRFEGVILDALDAPASGGTAPAVIAAAPFVVTTPEGTDYETKFQRVNWNFDNFTMLVRGASGYNGIQMANAMSCQVGDFVAVIATTYNPPSDPSFGITLPNGGTGIFFPRVGNNIFLYCGRVHIAGFAVGIYATEHLLMRGPVVAACLTGVMIGDSIHPIEGHVTVENCTRMLEVDPAAAQAQLNVQLEMEPFYTLPTAEPFDLETGGILKDVNNVARGRLDYQPWGQYNYYHGDARFKDGVANGTANYSSNTAAFVSTDVGLDVIGTNIPTGTTITSVTNGTTVVLSASATSGSSLVFYIKSRGPALQPNGASNVKITNINEPVGSNIARMWRSTAWDLPNGVYTPVPLNTESGPDAGHIANKANGKFVVTEPGWYQIQGNSGLWIHATEMRVRISVDGTDYGDSVAVQSGEAVAVSELVYCAAGAVIQLSMYQASGSAKAVYVADGMTFAPRMSVSRQ